jgi:hypothetical protein
VTIRKPAWQKLLDSQHDPASPNYKKWLMAHDYGAQFGPADADIQQISAWLQGHGFQVDYIAEGGQWIEFSGAAGQVEAAFHTEMHQYNVNGKLYTGNATEISLPRALIPVVGGVVSLNNFEKPPMLSGATLVGLGNSGSLVPVGSFTIGDSGSVASIRVTPSSRLAVLFISSARAISRVFTISLPCCKAARTAQEYRWGSSVGATSAFPMCKSSGRFSAFPQTIRRSSSTGPIPATRETS